MHLTDLATANSASRTKAHRWILIVDDDPAVLEALSTALAPSSKS